MKLLGFLFFSIFLFNADENASDNTYSAAPETVICDYYGGGTNICNIIDDGYDCHIIIDHELDEVFAGGPDC